jgi:hypothetical protein
MSSIEIRGFSSKMRSERGIVLANLTGSSSDNKKIEKSSASDTCVGQPVGVAFGVKVSVGISVGVIVEVSVEGKDVGSDVPVGTGLFGSCVVVGVGLQDDIRSDESMIIHQKICRFCDSNAKTLLKR